MVANGEGKIIYDLQSERKRDTNIASLELRLSILVCNLLRWFWIQILVLDSAIEQICEAMLHNPSRNRYVNGISQRRAGWVRLEEDMGAKIDNDMPYILSTTF